MEDVLDVYSQDYGDDTVLICLDETSRQQTKETRTPLPVRPGQPEGYDFEYERGGTAGLFMLHAPAGGWRHCLRHGTSYPAGFRPIVPVGQTLRPEPVQRDQCPGWVNE